MSLVGIKRCEEAVLKRCVLRRLAQVAVHFASSREDALDARRGCRCGKVLLHHLGKVGPKVLLSLPPVKHVYIKLRLLGIRKVLVKLVYRAGAAGESPSITASFLTRPPSSPPSDTFPCFFGGSTSVGVSGVGVGMPVVPTLGAATGRGFHTVDHSRRGPVVVNQVVNRVVNG